MPRISRKTFSLWFISICLALIALNVALRATHTHWPIFGWLWPLPVIAVVALTAGRLRDIGRNAWWAAACVIPLVALIAGVVLCFIPSAPFDRLRD